MMKPYNTVLVPRARTMRRQMTPAELRLWLDCLQSLPYKFRRQRPFGRYIADFYCPQLKLVIEVDGDSHYTDEGMAYDVERTQYLESLGLRVMRFTNAEVFGNLEAVRAGILSMTATGASRYSPCEAGGESQSSPLK